MTPKQLKESRQSLGLSVKEAANTFKVSYSGWGKWERGERAIPGLLVAAVSFYVKLTDNKRGPMKGNLIKMAFSEKIVIDGIAYDCVEDNVNTFTLVCSVSESREILELYKDRRKIPCYYKGVNAVVKIHEIKEQTMSDDKITMLVEIR